MSRNLNADEGKYTRPGKALFSEKCRTMIGYSSRCRGGSSSGSTPTCSRKNQSLIDHRAESLFYCSSRQYLTFLQCYPVRYYVHHLNLFEITDGKPRRISEQSGILITHSGSIFRGFSLLDGSKPSKSSRSSSGVILAGKLTT